MNARDTALSALIACRRNHAWSDSILKDYISRDHLDRRDAALCSRLCYGVIQNRMLLDFYLESFVKGGLKRLQPIVLDILRLAVYQIHWLDKVPNSAAVNEAVSQAKRYANVSASGLVNGVLRNFLRCDALPEPETDAVKYSHPQELVDLFTREFGTEKTAALLLADNKEAPVSLIVNPLRATEADVAHALEEDGILFTRSQTVPGCFLLQQSGSVENMELFRNGSVWVQDPGANLAARCAAPEKGQRVLDACAAPGGKSFACAAAMRDSGSILACDIHEKKLELIRRGAERLGMQSISTQKQDASAYRPEWDALFDTVVADVPCSGFGVIRKKPDIRYKNVRETEALPDLQLKILRNVSRYVKPGGILLYSTCTVLHRENEAVVERFFRENGNFVPEALPLANGRGENGMLTLYPDTDGTDGFFICRMRRKNTEEVC